MAVSVNLANVDGKRVRVTVVGIARSDRDYGGAFWSLGGYEPFYLPGPKVVSVEVLLDPLKVRDELDANSPEPGRGVVVLDVIGRSWQIGSSNLWQSTEGNARSWDDLTSDSPRRVPLTVLYVPEETQ